MSFYRTSVGRALLVLVASCKPSTPGLRPSPVANQPDAGSQPDARSYPDAGSLCATTGQVPAWRRPEYFQIGDPQQPSPDVRVLGAEVFFHEWPPIPPHYDAMWPEQLEKSSYKIRCRVDDSATLQRMWEGYKSVRASAPASVCPVYDARLMVVFSTSDHKHRWVAIGRPCGLGSRTLMVTDDYQQHEKDGALLRELANVVGAVADVEKADRAAKESR